jgi:hypothetical protein
MRSRRPPSPGSHRRSLIVLLTVTALLLPTAVVGAQTSSDPREGLGAGLHDAEEASRHLRLLASVEKPAGFTDPDDPDRYAVANSDLAFTGEHVIVGNYAGFLIYDISEPTDPRLTVAVSCPGGQGDVSVSGDLLFVSVQEMGTRDCTPLTPGDDPFLGVRVFDLSDIASPRQVAAVETCRGSHTHTLVEEPGAADVYVYVSGIDPVRTDGPPGLDCRVGPTVRDASGHERPSNDPADFDAGTRTSRFQIEIIRVPIDRPEDAAIVAEPRVFADGDGNPFGLEVGGRQGADGQTVATTEACHDITAFVDIGLAAAACEGNGILFDISDPTDPRRIQAVSHPSFAYWHSATFNSTGDKVVFSDEFGGGLTATCAPGMREDFGANAIYDLVQDGSGDPRLRFASLHKIPHVQTDTENCVAHNGSLVPVPGRDLFVQGWYQGGISVMDFTDSANPREVAFFDRGPVDEDEPVLGGHWAAYYYNGYVYGSEMTRGLDVLELTASEHLTAGELQQAADVRLPEFNPQSQPWIEDADSPCAGVAARAFRDVPAVPHGRNVACVAGYGIARGYDDGTFRPAQDISRAQMASFLQRMLRVAGAELPTAPTGPFSDVAGSPHAPAVNQLAELGIVQGTTGSRFEPDATVSRAQTAALLVRTLEHLLERRLPSTSGSFDDVPSNHPLAGAIDAAYEAGIVRGRSGSTFAPGEVVRRDQMGSFVVRSLELLHRELGELTPIPHP